MKREIRERLLKDEGTNCKLEGIASKTQGQMEEENEDRSTNILSLEGLTDEELQTLKGDVVGDTAYSSQWVLRTLLNLAKISETGWSTQLENELSMLWDMSAEKDIVAFLIHHGFLSMAEMTLSISSESRLSEIIIGIVANMCCEEIGLKTLEKEPDLITMIFSMVSTPDTKILIQIIRILEAIVWHIHVRSDSLFFQKWAEREDVKEAIPYILSNTLDDDLLAHTIGVVRSISDIDSPTGGSILPDLIKIEKLIPALFEDILDNVDPSVADFEKGLLNLTEHWITIVSNMLKAEIINFSDEENEELLKKLYTVISNYFDPYAYNFNMAVINAKAVSVLERCLEIATEFQQYKKTLPPTLFSNACLVLLNIKNEIDGCGKTDENDELVVLLESFLEFWIESIGFLEEFKLTHILAVLGLEKRRRLLQLTEMKAAAVKIGKLIKANDAIEANS